MSDELVTAFMCDVHGFSAALEACCNEADKTGWIERRNDDVQD